jgi:TonB-dependent SusC/RagA subfamily outer membrane receptor
MVHFGRCCHARAQLARRLDLLVALGALTACSHNRKPATEPSTAPGAAEASAPRSAGEGRTASGATQSLDAKELKADRAQSVEELIQGRFAGVQVIRLASGGFSLRIRGAGSFVSGNEPLYIVDGIALPPAPEGALIGVDPRDIERIEVLKDASSTSSYGVRGANGVILIKTKRGR